MSATEPPVSPRSPGIAARADREPVRHPRLAEAVAAKLRRDILRGVLKPGDWLPHQKVLLERYQVGPPALREALRILENEGLLVVQRGNVGGATVHLPTTERMAKMTAMVLEVSDTTLDDVGEAILRLEPVCVALCAERPDRAQTVLPELRTIMDRQERAAYETIPFGDIEREFHEALVRLCGNRTMSVTLGSLELLWSGHQHAWAQRAEHRGFHADDRAFDVTLSFHERIYDAIAAGDVERAIKESTKHLRAAHTYTVSAEDADRVDAELFP
jgi:DNA-binding FadR family transcriptional regulator